MAKGGYRKPSNPAPVSGPGALSQRTDGGPTQGAMEMSASQYGERKALQEMQVSAPMAGNSTPQRKVVGIFEPTVRPQEPVTAGAPMGPGQNYVDKFSQQISDNDPYMTLRAVYSMYPTDGLGNLINFIDSQGY